MGNILYFRLSERKVIMVLNLDKTVLIEKIQMILNHRLYNILRQN